VVHCSMDLLAELVTSYSDLRVIERRSNARWPIHKGFSV
jgi:hypothetical protein